MNRTFKIYTDHMSLKWLMNMETPTGRLARWIFFLQMFSFEINYIKGNHNICADAISRLEVNNLIIDSQETQRKKILSMHEELGHAGCEATYITLLKYGSQCNYKLVKSALENCLICKKYHQGPRNIRKFTNKITEPFDCVAIDLVGPIYKSDNGKRYIAVTIDTSTRWCISKALKFKSKIEVAKFLIYEVFMVFGRPNILISDQGLEFKIH